MEQTPTALSARRFQATRAAATPGPAASRPLILSFLLHAALVIAGASAAATGLLPTDHRAREANVAMEMASPSPMTPQPPRKTPEPVTVETPEPAPLPREQVEAWDIEPRPEPPLPPDPEPVVRDVIERRWMPFDGRAPGGLKAPRPRATLIATSEDPVAPPPTPPTLARPADAGPTPRPRPGKITSPIPHDRLNTNPAPRFGSGAVVVRLAVATDGTVSNVRVLSRTGPRILERTVTSTVKTWRFTPAYQDGNPISHPFTARFVF